MATDIWWHGQKQGSARMGEASRVTKLDHGRSPRRRLDEGSNLTLIQGWKESLGRLAVSVWPEAGNHNSRKIPAIHTILHMALWTMFLLTSPAAAVFINFENCLSPNIIKSNPQQLQFVPLYVWATLNSTSDSYGLNVTVYGNVAGEQRYTNPNDTVTEITDVGGVPPDQKFTTFTTQFNVLDYTPYNPPAERFCNSSALTPCPFVPVNVTNETQ